MSNVIGLDLSLTGTGIASTDGWTRVVGRQKVTTLPLAERIEAIDGLAAEIFRHSKDAHLVVIEQPAFSRTAGGAVERHALWWLVVRALHLARVPVAEVTARGRMRYATGKGAATKSAVVDAVARRLSAFETGGDDNIADAVVLAAMGADWLGFPLAPMPVTHRAALDAVKWPAISPKTPATTAGTSPRRETQ